MQRKATRPGALEKGSGAGDFFNFIISHHPAKLWDDKCFSASLGGHAFHVCARCLGGVIGLLSGILLFFVVGIRVQPAVAAFLLPLPAFIHWAFSSFHGRMEKAAGLFTGMLLGASVPAYYPGLFSLSPYFVSGAAFYLLFFIVMIRKRKP
ncbi:MAG TPA: DUF2085 domain-containing protein [Candidatus Micrarchaeota archaeon]|nr:DUF2085 domain-containing protein [Candidatus Micrarchaeota archaeon]